VGRIARTFAVPEGRDARIFAVAAVVDALGNGLYLPIAALFFTEVVGLPVEQVGVGLSITGVVALTGHVIGGGPIDRWGARRVVLVLNVLRALAYATFPLVGGFWAFVAVASLSHTADNVGRVASQALVASLVDARDRVTTAAFVRSVRNVGYGVGGLLVTLALSIGGRGPYVALVLGNAASFLLASLLLLRVRDARATPTSCATGVTSRSPPCTACSRCT
jgi:predicted MFS family arabinose efflux permease